MKKRAIIILTLISFILIVIQSCEFFKECDECFTPPQPIFMKIIDGNENNLLTAGIYSKDSLKLYYFDGTQKKSVVFITTTNSQKPDIIVSSDMAWFSINLKTDFFLYLNKFDTDTLTLEIEQKSDDCCTSHPIKSFTINGKTATMSSSDYIFMIKKSIGK
ncbi:MAG: hypothetical protein AB9846_17110 [Tenuifilaceae bacterium]